MAKKFDPDVRLSLQTMKLLSTFMQDPLSELSGAEIQKATGLASGTLYPILLRLEAAGWLTSKWEQVRPEDVGRPRRRLYTITRSGLAQSHREIGGLGLNAGNSPA